VMIRIRAVCGDLWTVAIHAIATEGREGRRRMGKLMRTRACCFHIVRHKE
jgi:hypothetical protein